jgi:hypothetical protein
MIYITGDTHSNVSRFSTTEFPEQMLMYKDWFFGHYHENRPIGRKFFMLYEKIIKLD